MARKSCPLPYRRALSDLSIKIRGYLFVSFGVNVHWACFLFPPSATNRLTGVTTLKGEGEARLLQLNPFSSGSPGDIHSRIRKGAQAAIKEIYAIPLRECLEYSVFPNPGRKHILAHAFGEGIDISQLTTDPLPRLVSQLWSMPSC